MIIHLYTDGGARPIPNGGGWRAAWAFIEQRDGKFFTSRSGHFIEENPTNQRAELWAAVEALTDASPEASEILLFSDSQYLVMGVTQWMPRWLKNGWRTSQKRQVENKDIWLKLLRASEGLPISWVWVPRSSVPGNVEVDLLVQEVFHGAD
jgi:ribonuclease HI